MRLTCVIQSTSYADMLALTLPINKVHFNSVVVYTRTGDEATKQVCLKEQVLCVETDGFSKGGSKFNRGAVYNEFLRSELSHHSVLRWEPSWVVILDSDIVLPSDFRGQFEALPPDREHFYGARRYNVETMDQWVAVRQNPNTLKNLTLFRGYGYGYLQIFHPSSSTFRSLWTKTHGNPYPEWMDGSTADWMFRNEWGDHPWDPYPPPPDHALLHNVPEPCDPPRGLLKKLPFHVIHLGVTGINSTGRHTPLWDTSKTL